MADVYPIPETTAPDERWLPALGYEGVYEVSSHGRVRRCDALRRPTQPFLRPSSNHHGYQNVSLSRNCKGRTFFVHRLVAEAFNGPRPTGMTINHKNGIKTDNRPENLEYLTHQENMRHAKEVINRILPTRARGARNGYAAGSSNVLRGEQIASAKLNAEKVLLARELLAAGQLQQREIASIVGISQTQIWRIKVGLSWAHIKP